MWFKRRDIGYAKSLQQKEYGHMKVKVKKWRAHKGSCIEKNDDEHMKAHVLKKKKDSHVSKY